MTGRLLTALGRSPPRRRWSAPSRCSSACSNRAAAVRAPRRPWSGSRCRPGRRRAAGRRARATPRSARRRRARSKRRAATAEPAEPPTLLGRPRRGTAFEIAHVLEGAQVDLESDPDGPVVAKLGDETEFGSPVSFSVVATKPGWLGVTAPELPNGELGWIARDPTQGRGLLDALLAARRARPAAASSSATATRWSAASRSRSAARGPKRRPAATASPTGSASTKAPTTAAAPSPSAATRRPNSRPAGSAATASRSTAPPARRRRRIPRLHPRHRRDDALPLRPRPFSRYPRSFVMRANAASGQQQVVLGRGAVGADLEGRRGAVRAGGGDRVLAGRQFGGEGAGAVGGDRLARSPTCGPLITSLIRLPVWLAVTKTTSSGAWVLIGGCGWFWFCGSCWCFSGPDRDRAGSAPRCRLCRSSR